MFFFPYCTRLCSLPFRMRSPPPWMAEVGYIDSAGRGAGRSHLRLLRPGRRLGAARAARQPAARGAWPRLFGPGHRDHQRHAAGTRDLRPAARGTRRSGVRRRTGLRSRAGHLPDRRCTIVRLPVDAQGLDPATLPARGLRPRLVYVTPSHQFPTGAVMPVARRFALLNWARTHGASTLSTATRAARSGPRGCCSAMGSSGRADRAGDPGPGGRLPRHQAVMAAARPG
jgi:hypothetical protein